MDSREGFRWSKEANGWEPLSSGDILNARKSVRIARGESAPGVVTAPIKVQAAHNPRLTLGSLFVANSRDKTNGHSAADRLFLP